MACSNEGSTPTKTCTHWIKRLSCNATYQEVNLINLMHTGEKAHKPCSPGQKSPEVQNKGISGPTNKICVLQKNVWKKMEGRISQMLGASTDLMTLTHRFENLLFHNRAWRFIYFSSLRLSTFCTSKRRSMLEWLLPARNLPQQDPESSHLWRKRHTQSKWLRLLNKQSVFQYFVLN